MDSENSTSLVQLFQLNDDTAILITGVIYFCVTLPIFPLFFIIMKAIYLKNKAGSNLTFKLMNIINTCQLAQAFSHCTSAPMLIFPVLHAKLSWFINVLGCLINVGWICDFPVMILLAVCRILIFTNFIQLKKLPIFAKVILFIIAFWGLFLFIFGSYSQYFVLVTPGWSFDYSLPTIAFFDFQELIISFTCLPLSYFAYIFMAYLIYAKKNLSSSVTSRKNEIMILLQSTFVTFYITVLIVIWHQGMFTTVTIVDMSIRRNQAILNGCVMMHCYVNPTLTLICNKSIRDDCMKLLGVRKQKKSLMSLSGASASSRLKRCSVLSMPRA